MPTYFSIDSDLGAPLDVTSFTFHGRKNIDKEGRRELIRNFLQSFAESPKESTRVYYKENVFVDANSFYQSLKNEAARWYGTKIRVYYNVKSSRSEVFLYKEQEFADEMKTRYALNVQKFNDSVFKKKTEKRTTNKDFVIKTDAFNVTGGHARTLRKVEKVKELKKKYGIS